MEHGKARNGGLRRVAGRLARAWCRLTLAEQHAVAVILALALLGLVVRAWHQRRPRPERAGAVSAAPPGERRTE